MIDFNKARARAEQMSLEEETEIIKRSLEESGIDYRQDEKGIVTILTTKKQGARHNIDTAKEDVRLRNFTTLSKSVRTRTKAKIGYKVDRTEGKNVGKVTRT